MLAKFLERWLRLGKIALCVCDFCSDLAQQQFQIIFSKYCVMNGLYENKSDYVLCSGDLWLAFPGIFGWVTIFELLCQHAEYSFSCYIHP